MRQLFFFQPLVGWCTKDERYIATRKFTNAATTLIVYPALPSNLDRFPCQANMTVIALRAKCAVVLVVLLMAAYTTCSQNHLRSYRGIVAVNAFEFLVLSIQLEVGFVVIKVPIFPIAGVVTFLAARTKRAPVRILFFMA